MQLQTFDDKILKIRIETILWQGNLSGEIVQSLDVKKQKKL